MMRRPLFPYRAPFFAVGEGAALALIPKTGSSSLANAVIRSEPALTERFERLHVADGFERSQLRLQGMVPKCSPAGRKVAVVLRDPVGRFRSALTETRTAPEDVDALLDRLEEGAEENGHFFRQSNHLLRLKEEKPTELKIFPFPEGVAQAAEWLGLPAPLDLKRPNGEPDVDIELSAAQESRVRAIYEDDLAAYEACL